MTEQYEEEPLTPQIGPDGEVQLYEPGEIPPYWKDALDRFGIRVLRLAMTFGLVIPEYTMRDYVNHAVETSNGYETIAIWGCQGSKKSCRTMIISHWVYQDWDAVLEEMVLVPNAMDLPGYEKRGFLQKMKAIEKGKCVPLLAWDDLTVGMPSASFKTDIEQYGAIDSAWAAIRTKIKVVVLNCPLIDRIGRNVKDNISMEVFLGRNQVELIERYVRLVGLKHLESNFFKVQVKPLHVFDWRYVPRDVFQQYFNLRLEIAEFAIQKMGKAFKDESVLLEDMVTPFQIMNEVSIAPSTLNDMLRRNFIPSEKINGKTYVRKADFEEFKKLQERLAQKRKKK
jgi:hypothetical protein